ncbi:MAG: deferrochelatase/peroxidase EfeB, partial [Solirubrobacteraceae bacterium]|nr:deferrochelatase/peroxidase EfeB [Solirubrobacteraceae bacterium]
MEPRRASTRKWGGRVPIGERGPGQSYRPDDLPPSVYGARQPGITTPVLDHLAFAALDVTADDREVLRDLVGELTLAAERLMRAAHRPPGTGVPAGALTLTIGLGPGIFTERFGLGARPLALAPLPAFPGDALDPARCGGDLCVQGCAADERTAAAALAELLAVAEPAARLRWSQRAAMHRHPADHPQGRPRNLLGFKDATSNPRRGRDLDRHVW